MMSVGIMRGREFIIATRLLWNMRFGGFFVNTGATKDSGGHL